MKKILIATRNRAKFKELESGTVASIGKSTKILSLNDLKIKEGIDETGLTFENNARIKAKYYGDISALPTIADDSGLVIPVLNNEPGVKSRRWLGYDAPDDELIRYTLHRLRDVKKINRKAYLEVCLCFYEPGVKKIICESEKIFGHIAKKPSGRPTQGYPFRAVFIVDRFNKYYDELTRKEHNQINHRLRALKRLIRKIEEYLIK